MKVLIPELVEKMGYGKTAIVATMKFSDDGPVVAFRADMDSNDVIESKASNHIPAKNGFRSRHEKAMHACGHDTYDNGPWPCWNILLHIRMA